MMNHFFLDNATLEPSKVKALGNLPYFGYSTVDYFLMPFIVKIIEYGVNKNTQKMISYFWSIWIKTIDGYSPLTNRDNGSI